MGLDQKSINANYKLIGFNCKKKLIPIENWMISIQNKSIHQTSIDNQSKPYDFD